MAARPAPAHEVTRRPARQGVVAHTASRIGRALRWLMLSLLFSIVIECLGIVFWWPEAGLGHSRQMLSREIGYLEDDFRQSVLSSDPGRLARGIAEQSRYFLFEVTGMARLINWLSGPAATSEKPLRRKLQRIYRSVEIFVLAAIQIVQVFSVRLAILWLSIPVYILFSLVGLIDGLVQRDLRRWGGGRESSYLYHYARNSIWTFALTAWVGYLALPFSLHPVYIVLPFVILFAASISITASTFKKYL